MIIRALTSDHDWTFGAGQQNYLKDNDAIGLNAQTRLLSFLNDCFFDLSAGIDWFYFLGHKGTVSQIELTVRAILLASYGVLKVNSVTVAVSARQLTLSYNIDTIYTPQYAQTVEVFNG